MYFWMPQAIRSFSSTYSNAKIGILQCIPSLCGLMAMIIVSRSSDRWRERRYHVAIPLIVAGIALLLLRTAMSPALSIVWWSFVAIGVSSFSGPFWSLPNEWLPRACIATGIALINSVGSLGGFFGPIMLGWIVQTKSLLTGLAFAGTSLIGGATLVLCSVLVGHRRSSV